MKRSINIRLGAFSMLLAIFLLPASGQDRQRGGQGQVQRQGQSQVQRQDQRQGQGQNQGQRRQMTEQDITDRVNRLAEGLELTDEQKKKILDYEIAEFKKNAARRESFSGGGEMSQQDRDAMRAAMSKSRELREKKYEEVMTKEQYEKYTKEREERMNQRQRQQGTPNQQGDRPPRGRR